MFGDIYTSKAAFRGMISKISDSVVCITEEDMDLDLFESRYPIPDGVTYNSYVILDDKVAVLDTADECVTDAWLADLKTVLNGRSVDYLVIHHMEPDHAANIATLADMYPDMKLVGNDMIFRMVTQFFGIDYSDRSIVMEEGGVLELGKHSLRFVMAPLVHWPEVMMSYEQSDRLLFTADGFGRFGPADPSYDWCKGARRYYFNIVGKFGKQVMKLLDKVSDLEISAICPLHGPILKEDLGHYVSLYRAWASYTPEDKGVFIAYTSVYGNTRKAVMRLAELLDDRGINVKISDLSRTDLSYALEDAFRYDRLAVATTTYEGGVFPEMEFFLMELKSKKYQNRKVAMIDNGTWAPNACNLMKKYFEGMTDITILEPVISIRSAMNDGDRKSLEDLAAELAKD